MKTVLLIPARSGSSRIKNKNLLKLGSLKLIEHTIILAKKIKFIDKIFISTDSDEILKISKKYSLFPDYKRPKKLALKYSRDYEWIIDAMDFFNSNNDDFDNFMILRPTSPFRTAKTINKAFTLFKRNHVDSLRAVRLCGEHPFKMWKIESRRLKPLFNKMINHQPAHSSPYQILPKVYVQDSSLEISKTKNLYKYKNISGKRILPFIMPNYEGFDINFPLDIKIARQIYKEIK